MSAADVDKVMVHGLGRRYAFMGPFQTIHLNAEGAIRTSCKIPSPIFISQWTLKT